MPDSHLAAIETISRYPKLASIWKDMGYSDDAIERRQQIVRKHVTDLLDDMVTEEEACKTELILKIEELLKEADTLSKELKIEIKIVCADTLPLLNMEQIVKEQLTQYREIRERRVERLAVLLKDEDTLVSVLGIPRYTQLTPVPSEEELVSFQTHLRAKAEDKRRLEDLFLSTRESIRTILEDLELAPSTAFEKQVFAGVGVFQLTPDNMAKLQELHQSSEQRQSEAKALAYQLREKLSQLWERLNEPADLRENFVTGYVGHSSETIQALRAEIRRCEEKKRENLKHFVQTVRLELVAWWDRCHFNAEQRSRFKHLSSDYYNEDLLELHEQEVNAVKSFYQENEQIFNMIAEREEMWAKMIELDDLSSKPNRFGNRGGKLLQEENARKKIKKDLPRLEKRLEKLVGDFETAKGEKFLFDGKNYLDIVKMQWEDFEEKKESEKVARKARNNAGDVTHSAHKSVAGNTLKRKVATPAAAKELKRSRIDTPAKDKPMVKRKMFNAAKVVPHVDQPDLFVNVENETYTDFQDYLSNKVSTRSSAKMCLQATTNRAATPSKTPLKPALSLARATPASSSRTPTLRSPRNTPGRLQAVRVPFRF